MSQSDKRPNRIKSICFHQLILQRFEKDPVTGLNIGLVKRIYRNKFRQLRNIINRFDPMHLINIGAPADEYEPEVSTILLQLGNVKTKTQTLDLVHQEFCRWFGENVAGERRDYIKLARAIYNWKIENFTEPFPKWILN
jgi:hypothetical protein